MAAYVFLTEIHRRYRIQVFRSCFVFHYLGFLDFDRFASLSLSCFIFRYFLCFAAVLGEPWKVVFPYLWPKRG